MSQGREEVVSVGIVARAPRQISKRSHAVPGMQAEMRRKCMGVLRGKAYVIPRSYSVKEDAERLPSACEFTESYI